MTDNLQPWTQWIGTETIATFYAEGIRRWGGAASDPKPGCIDAALGAAYNAELYSPESEEEGFIQGLVFAGFCSLSFHETLLYRWKQANRVGLLHLRSAPIWSNHRGYRG